MAGRLLLRRLVQFSGSDSVFAFSGAISFSVRYYSAKMTADVGTDWKAAAEKLLVAQRGASIDGVVFTQQVRIFLQIWGTIFIDLFLRFVVCSFLGFSS